MWVLLPFDQNEIKKLALTRIRSYFEKLPFLIDIIVGLISGLLLLATMIRHGIGFTNDSIYYIEVSRNIWEGVGFFYENGDPYVLYAPMYSMLLAVSNIFPLDPLNFSSLLNAIFYGLLLSIIVCWYRKLGNRGVILFLGVMIILGSRPIFKISTMVWSELFFIFTSTIFLLSISKYISGGLYEHKYLKIAIVAAMFSSLFRYVGITLILTGILLLIFKKYSFKRKVEDVVSIAVFSSLPTGFFVIRNFYLTGTLVGNRYPTNRSFSEVIQNLLYSFSNLFIPDIFPDYTLLILSIPIIITMTTIIYFLIRFSEKESKFLSYVYSSTVFISVYIIYIFASANFVGFDAIGGRLISPLYVPILMIILIFITILWGRNNEQLNLRNPLKIFENRIIKIRSLRRIKRPLLFLMFLISFGMILSVLYHTIYNLDNFPGGWTESEIQDSDTINFVMEYNPEGKLYTNHPNFFFGTELEGDVHLSPRETYQTTDIAPDDLTQFNRTMKLRGSVVVIWFDMKHDYVYSIDELKNMYDFQIIKSFNDGVVYRFYLKE